MNFLKGIQEQPKHIRKIIFWTIVVILGVFFLFTWIESVKVRIEGAKQEKIFEKDIEAFPKIEMPEFSIFNEEELEQPKEELIK